MGGLAVLGLLGLYIFLAITVFNAAKTTPAKVIAVLLILLIPTADAIYGRIKLQQMCKAEAGLKVYKVAHNVEGFMDDSADEIWIRQYGYQYSEGDSSPKIYYRISKQNDQFVREDNVTPKSEYQVQLKKIGSTKDTYMRRQYLIKEIAKDEILATNTQVAFNGGWAERLIALFSDAGGGAVAWCSNVELDSWQRKIKIIINTLKHSGE